MTVPPSGECPHLSLVMPTPVNLVRPTFRRLRRDSHLKEFAHRLLLEHGQLREPLNRSLISCLDVEMMLHVLQCPIRIRPIMLLPLQPRLRML